MVYELSALWHNELRQNTTSAAHVLRFNVHRLNFPYSRNQLRYRVIILRHAAAAVSLSVSKKQQLLGQGLSFPNKTMWVAVKQLTQIHPELPETRDPGNLRFSDV